MLTVMSVDRCFPVICRLSVTCLSCSVLSCEGGSMFTFFLWMFTWSLEGCPFLLDCGRQVGLTSALCSGPLAFSLGPPVV